MKAALVIYGSLETISGGYLYDRMLVAKLRLRGDQVQIVSQHRRAYGASLIDNFSRAAPPDADVLIQDELNHPSLFLANRRGGRAPIVSIVHHLRSSERRASWQNALYRTVEQAYLKSVDGFIFNSDTTRESVQRLVGSSRPCIVAPPGADRLGFATPDLISARMAHSGPLQLVTVGSITPAKGIEVLMRAMHALRGEAVRLEVIGPDGGPPAFAAHMRQRASDQALPITFSGALSDREMREHLLSADVFVLPSFYEGYGIAFVEGMAQGLPAIGASAGAVPALITEGVNGFLVAPGNAEQLTERIRDLVRNKELLLRMSLNALRSARQLPTWDQATDDIRAFLFEMVAGSR